MKTKTSRRAKNSKEENNQVSEQNKSLHNENEQLSMRHDLLTQELNNTKNN